MTTTFICSHCNKTALYDHEKEDTWHSMCPTCYKKQVKKVKSVKLNAHAKLNAYEIIYRAVEEGVEYGWNRAHKHVDDPNDLLIKQSMIEGVTNALSEVLVYDDKGEEK